MIVSDTSGLRMVMGDSFTKGYLMSLIDEAERLISSDPFGEERPPVSYTLKEKEERREDPLESVYREASSCRLCQACSGRRMFAHPVVASGPKVLFIAPSPEGSVIFSPESLLKFRAWWELSLLLHPGEWALTTLIKCPSSPFSPSAADQCRPFLRSEMSMMKPEAMVLLGHDTACYMLRRSVPMDEMRQKRFVVNHIPVFVTYTPLDYLHTPSLQRDIWNDMLFIRREVGTEGRKR